MPSATGQSLKRHFRALGLGRYPVTIAASVEYPTREQRFTRVLERLGRPHDRRTVDGLARAFATAKTRPEATESDRHCDLSTYRTYPEVVEVITTLHRHDVEIVIVSDFHVDLRRCDEA